MVNITTNESCTLYRKSFADGKNIYERYFILHIMLQRRDSAAIKNNGMAKNAGQSRATSIYIPHQLIPDGLVIRVGDIIIIGCCQTAADESGYGEICSMPDSLTVISSAIRQYGSRTMHHTEVQCV